MIEPGAMAPIRSFPALMIAAPPVESQIARKRTDESGSRVKDAEGRGGAKCGEEVNRGNEGKEGGKIRRGEEGG